MAIDPVSSSNTSAGSGGMLTGNNTLGKDQFLQLLVAQISHQDPLNPLDDKEFIAQLAQFSSLEQLMQSNERLALLQMSQGAVANAQVSDLIGREIVATGDDLRVTADGAQPLSFSLEGNATSVTVRITNAQGQLVRTVELGATSAGSHNVAWDGTADDGSALPPGTYSVAIEATDANGAAVPAASEVSGVVSAVTFENGYAELVVGDLRIRPADVIRIAASTTSTTPTTP